MMDITEVIHAATEALQSGEGNQLQGFSRKYGLEAIRVVQAQALDQLPIVKKIIDDHQWAISPEGLGWKMGEPNTHRHAGSQGNPYPAFRAIDRAVIINTNVMTAVQSESSMLDAKSALGILNDHEVRNGRDPIYEIRSIPKFLYNQAPASWVPMARVHAVGQVAGLTLRTLIPGSKNGTYPTPAGAYFTCRDDFGNAVETTAMIWENDRVEINTCRLISTTSRPEIGKQELTGSFPSLLAAVQQARRLSDQLFEESYGYLTKRADAILHGPVDPHARAQAAVVFKQGTGFDPSAFLAQMDERKTRLSAEQTPSTPPALG